MKTDTIIPKEAINLLEEFYESLKQFNDLKDFNHNETSLTFYSNSNYVKMNISVNTEDDSFEFKVYVRELEDTNQWWKYLTGESLDHDILNAACTLVQYSCPEIKLGYFGENLRMSFCLKANNLEELQEQFGESYAYSEYFDKVRHILLKLQKGHL